MYGTLLLVYYIVLCNIIYTFNIRVIPKISKIYSGTVLLPLLYLITLILTDPH
jgi:hypothetical protein